MKKIYFSILLAALLLLPATSVIAHDFYVGGIYYNITDATEKTVAVTYRGDSYNYSNEYRGAVTIPSTVTYSGTTYSVTSIGEGAFQDCPGLTSIEIPGSVTSIGDYAFTYCTGLTNVVIGNGVTSIGYGAFYYCRGFTSIVVASGNVVYDSRNNCNAIIETESNTLVAGCKNTIIPNSVTSIGSFAFDGCTGLTSIEIPGSVTSIGYRAFYACSGLTSIEIPNSVTSIGSYAFQRCNLSSIEIPAGLTSIGEYAFSWNPLTSITLAEGNSSFTIPAGSNCLVETATNTVVLGIEDAIIPDGITAIGNGAFNGNTTVTTVTIPASVTSIGEWAFEASNLSSLTVFVTTPPTAQSSTFQGRYNTTTVYVPIGAKAAYEAAEYWSDFANIVETDFTGIDDIISDGVVENGEPVIYDLSGRRILEPVKGVIYIINGKKVVF